MGKLYISKKIQWYNNRPVQKIEVIKEDKNEVMFETDYPVERITISRQEFDEKFTKW